MMRELWIDACGIYGPLIGLKVRSVATCLRVIGDGITNLSHRLHYKADRLINY